jgi:hypothetical protein
MLQGFFIILKFFKQNKMKKRRTFTRSVIDLAFCLLFFIQGIVAQSSNITGRWTLNVNTSQGNGKPVFDLKQENDSVISGHYKGQFGEAPVTGKVRGDSFEFGYTIRDITVKYIGRFSKKSMEGKSIYGTIGEGTFTGKRKRK